MDTSCNHLREPGYQESSFIRARGYLHDLSKPEKEALLTNLVRDTGNILVENFPDEEDLTQVMQEGQSVLKFKDKIFNPEKCSGMGKVFLRKNLVKNVHDCGRPMNILTQEMFEDEHGLPLVNTVFIIQYDYDLDKGFITIPENSILVFAGGSISNGTVILRNTLILPAALDIEHFMSVNIRGSYREGSLVYLRKHLRLFDGQNWVNIGGPSDLGPKDKFEIIEFLKAYVNKCLDIVAPFKIELIPEKNYIEKGVHDIKVSWNYNRLINNQDIRLESGSKYRIYQELDKRVREYTFENIDTEDPVTIVIATTYKGETVSEAVTLTFNQNPGLIIDDELNEESTNPVTNRAITAAIRAIEERLNSFITEEDLGEYLKKSEAADTYQPKGNYITEHQDLSEYAKSADVAANYQPKGDYQPRGNYLTEDSLNGYAKTSDLNNYALKNHTHSIDDVNGLRDALNHADTKYSLSKNGSQIVLTGTDGSTSSVTDETGGGSVVVDPTVSPSAANAYEIAKINGTPIYGHDAVGSGGDGSEVHWNQIRQSGEHIATITINGTPTNVYAPEGDGQSSSQFKEMIFNRSETKPSKPVGGTYTNPITSAMAALGWTDGPSSGTGTLWFSTKLFQSDGSSVGDWSEPEVLADSEVVDVCYHPSVSKPSAPTTHGSQGTNVNTWHDEGNENDRWLAMSIKNDGTWGPWSIIKIQGERGEDGTSIKIVGSYDNSSDELTVGSNKIVSGVISAHMSIPSGHTLTEGDCLTVEGGELDGHVIYLSDTSPQTWIDLGVIKGSSEYLHIKFSNDGGAHFTPASGGYAAGETPGKYIGMYTDSNKEDSQDVNDYKPWILFKGQDGAGYWFLYTVNNGTKPESPGCTHVSEEERKHGFIDDNDVEWVDEPHELQQGEYEWRIWLRDSEETLCWSDVTLYNIGVSNGNTYNLIFNNQTPVYYDSNNSRLTQGTISWNFYMNGDDKTNNYTYRVLDDQGVQKQHTNNQLNVAATDNYKYIIVEVYTGSTLVYKEQYVFPVKGLNGDSVETTGFRISMNPDFGAIACNSDGSSIQGATVSTVLSTYYNENPVQAEYNIQRTPTDPFDANISGNVLTVTHIDAGNAVQVNVPFTITYNGNTYIKSFSVIRDKDGNVYNLDVTPQVYTSTDAESGKVIEAKVYKTYDRTTGSHAKTLIPTSEYTAYGLTLQMGATSQPGTTNVYTLSPSDNSNIEISLYENGTLIQSEIVDYLATGEGKQGIQGCVLRNCGVYNPNTTYVNEAYYVPQTANYIRYIDYVLYPAPTDVNDVYYYMVAPKTTGDGRREITNIDPTNTENWIQAENMDFAYIKNLIADYIDAKTITTDELLIKRTQQGTTTIVAGMTKGDMTQSKEDNAILWAGSEGNTQINIKNSPFVVYEDGHIKATNAEISGNITAQSLELPDDGKIDVNHGTVSIESHQRNETGGFGEVYIDCSGNSRYNNNTAWLSNSQGIGVMVDESGTGTIGSFTVGSLPHGSDSTRDFEIRTSRKVGNENAISGVGYTGTINGARFINGICVGVS